MEPKLQQIRYFVAVAQTLHFRRAAEKVNVAQPALSRAVAQLEGALGVTLLARTNRQVALTEPGRVFLDRCRDSLDLLERAVTDARRAAAGEIGALSLAYTDFAISGTLPSLVEQFRSRYPEIELELTHRFTNQQLLELESESLDFGFLTGPIDRADLDWVTVQEDRFVVVLYPDHPLAAEPEIPLSALAGEPFVLGTPSSWVHYHDHLFRLCRGAGFAPRMVQSAFNTEGIFGLIASGMGITVLNESVLNYHRKGLVVRPLKDCAQTTPTLAAWNARTMTPIKARFVAFLRERLPEAS